MTTPKPRGRPRAFHDKTEQNTVQSLDRALHILDVLAASQGMTLTDLSQAADEAPATVYRALVTFQTRAMVELELPGQIWHVGPGTFRMGSSFLRRTKFVERARGPMDQLMRETGETANLGIEAGDEVLFLSQVETHEAIRAFFPPGTKALMHASGIGKALLAWYPESRLARLIAAKGLTRFTPHTLADSAALAADLAATRARGYAFDDQERAPGMRCVASAIFNSYGEPVAGLSVSGPAFRMEGQDIARLGTLVRTAADTVTREIGGICPEVSTLS